MSLKYNRKLFLQLNKFGCITFVLGFCECKFHFDTKSLSPGSTNLLSNHQHPALNKNIWPLDFIFKEANERCPSSWMLFKLCMVWDRIRGIARSLSPYDLLNTWWRHQMGTFSALMVLCAGDSLEFTAQRPGTRCFDLFFDLHLNKRLIKQSWGWWFETPSCPLWRHCNEPPHINICIDRMCSSYHSHAMRQI